jgi:hypothetical protein
MNFAMATLGLKEMEKFLWEGREKSLPSWLSQFSFAKGSDSLVLLENAKENLVFHFGGGRHASFPQKTVVKHYLQIRHSMLTESAFCTSTP